MSAEDVVVPLADIIADAVDWQAARTRISDQEGFGHLVAADDWHDNDDWAVDIVRNLLDWHRVMNAEPDGWPAPLPANRVGPAYINSAGEPIDYAPQAGTLGPLLPGGLPREWFSPA